MVLGVDLNFTFPSNYEWISGDVIFERKARHTHRLNEFLRFLAAYDLVATYTFGPMTDHMQPIYTWHDKSFSQRTQIEYLFVTRNMKCTSSAQNGPCLESDHYLVLGNIVLEDTFVELPERHYSLKRAGGCSQIHFHFIQIFCAIAVLKVGSPWMD